jgi:hypothetical protein
LNDAKCSPIRHLPYINAGATTSNCTSCGVSNKTKYYLLSHKQMPCPFLQDQVQDTILMVSNSMCLSPRSRPGGGQYATISHIVTVPPRQTSLGAQASVHLC